MINPHKLQTRASHQELQTRTQSMDTLAVPESYDESTRSVEIIVATEAPVEIYDSRRGQFVPEVLLMSGLKPKPRQIPLIDSHNRGTTENLHGSAREFHVEDPNLLARAYFSSVQASEDALTKTREGHITDVSAGYRVHAVRRLERGQTETIEGKQFTGPVNVVTRWSLHEVSLVIIGADEAAKIRSAAGNHSSKENQMNKALMKVLHQMGLAADATPEQARAFMAVLTADQVRVLMAGLTGDALREFLVEAPAEALRQATQPPAPADDGDDPPAPPADHGQRAQDGGDPPAISEADARRIAEGERRRIASIRGMGAQFDIPDDQIDQYIERGLSVDDAQTQVLLIAAQRNMTAPGVRVSHGADEVDKFRAAATDSLCMRAGIGPETPAPGAADLRGLTLRELARECLKRSGRHVPADPLDMVGRALTTSDLPILLTSTADRQLMTAFDQAEETWNQVFDTGQVSDFKTHKIGRASEVPDLDEIPEGGEYEYGKMSEKFEEYAVVTWGKIMPISRQAIINDDLSALTDAPTKQGESCSRKLGDIAWAVVTANAAMGDGVALFHATHANLLSGAAIGFDSMTAAQKAMATQKDLLGKRRLNIKPVYLALPLALWGESEQFFGTLEFGPASSTPGMKNPFAGKIPPENRIYEARLDDFDPNAWFLFGAKGKTVRVFGLSGPPRPYMERDEEFHRDALLLKVRLDAGAKALDWVAMTKNPGPS